MTENEFQKSVIQYLVDEGHLVIRINQRAKGGRNYPARWWSAYHNGGRQNISGISDVLSVDMEGRLFCWELKAVLGMAREMQITFQDEARRRGAVVAIVKDFETVRGLCEVKS